MRHNNIRDKPFTYHLNCFNVSQELQLVHRRVSDNVKDWTSTWNRKYNLDRICYLHLVNMSQASAKLLPSYLVFIPVCTVCVWNTQINGFWPCSDFAE